MRLNPDFLYRRSKKITTDLEEKYNLHKAKREKISPNTPITKVGPNGDFSCQREQNGACSNYAERSRERREAHIKRQVANTVKMVGIRYKFQSMGEYNAILGLYNVRCDTADGRVNGHEYHGLVYFATDDNGNTIATPLKTSRLGKEFSANALNARFIQQTQPTEQAPTATVVPIPTLTNTTSESQSTSSAGSAPAPTLSQSSHSDSGDYGFTLPGLDLFQPGQSFNPDEEEFRRRMQRKKKGIRRRF